MVEIDSKLLIALIVFLGGVIGTLFWILKSNYEKQLKEKDEEIKYLRRRTSLLFCSQGYGEERG